MLFASTVSREALFHSFSAPNDENAARNGKFDVFLFSPKETTEQNPRRLAWKFSISSDFDKSQKIQFFSSAKVVVFLPTISAQQQQFENFRPITIELSAL